MDKTRDVIFKGLEKYDIQEKPEDYRLFQVVPGSSEFLLLVYLMQWIVSILFNRLYSCVSITRSVLNKKSPFGRGHFPVAHPWIRPLLQFFLQYLIPHDNLFSFFQF